ncbi:ACP S-malonyltransferase [Peptococcus simiae]|uniref:ACP S-malonyltransferase n=1 Tax=Peptococcus simiae TaxID=1643805 RepID=UPI0039817D23
MICLLYAGQGSQAVGMGLDFYEADPAAKALYDRYPQIREASFWGPQESLNETAMTQPAMGLFAAVVTDYLTARGLVPDMAMGLSLGEYSALYAADSFSADQLVQLLEVRGAAMQEAGQLRPGAMAAILGLDRDRVGAICADLAAETGQVIALANDNAPAQQVIGGEKTALEEAALRLKAAGARRVVPLQVSGAFHTPLMAPAAETLAEALAKTPPRAPRIPVLANASASRLAGDGVAESLIAQLTSPLRLVEGFEEAAVLGARTFIEIGPGKVLTGLARKTLGKDINIHSVETVAGAEDLLAHLGGKDD